MSSVRPIFNDENNELLGLWYISEESLNVIKNELLLPQLIIEIICQYLRVEIRSEYQQMEYDWDEKTNRLISHKYYDEYEGGIFGSWMELRCDVFIYLNISKIRFTRKAISFKCDWRDPNDPSYSSKDTMHSYHRIINLDDMNRLLYFYQNIIGKKRIYKVIKDILGYKDFSGTPRSIRNIVLGHKPLPIPKVNIGPWRDSQI